MTAFSEFHGYGNEVCNSKVIIDASLLLPLITLTPVKNEQIKQGAGDKLWNDNPHKKCHRSCRCPLDKKRDETFTATSSIQS